MKIAEAMRSLRMAADFSGEPVEAAEVAGVLEAARWTPSAANTQAWEVVVVRGPEGRRAVASAALDPLLRADGDLKPAWPEQAPVLLVFCADLLRVKCRFGEVGTVIAREDVASAALAAALAAGELGLAGVFFREVDPAALARSLGLPDGVEPVGVLALGRPSRPASRPPAMPVEAFTHLECWGGGGVAGPAGGAVPSAAEGRSSTGAGGKPPAADRKPPAAGPAQRSRG